MNKETQRSFKYFENFDEGQNITITCDFFLEFENIRSYVEELEKKVKELEEKNERLKDSVRLILDNFDFY